MMEFIHCNNSSSLWNNSANCTNFYSEVDANATKYSGVTCGRCQGTCIYSAVEVCFIIGLLANFVVIFIVVKDKQLRHPTFIGIATLALADFMFLSVNLIVSFETVITSLLCMRPLVVSRPFYIINSVCWFSANSHVALLAIIRYVSLANPLRACAVLRPVRVVLLSCGVWILGLLLLGTLSVLITLGMITPGVSTEFIIIWWILVYLLPLFVTVILHILKVCLVKRAVIQSNLSPSTNRKLVQRMSTIVVLVIVMATVLPLPRLIFNCLRVVGAFPSGEFKMHFRGVSRLLYLINHFINPFMYGCLSRKFRGSFKRMFACAVVTDVDNTKTNDSSISSRKSSVSMEIKQRHSALKSENIELGNNNNNCQTISTVTTC